MQHAKDFGFTVEGKIGFDVEAIVERSREVAAQLNAGVGFLMKKNKVDVIWGEATIAKPGEVRSASVEAAVSRRTAKPFWRRHLSGQAHHPRHRRAGARRCRGSSPTAS